MPAVSQHHGSLRKGPVAASFSALPPDASHLLCESGVQDPSGPILIDGVWHVFPDGNGKGGGKGWSHFTSRDLLRWTEQKHSVVADGDTGSVSKTESGIIVLYPDGTPRTLQRQVPTNEASGQLSLDVEWSAPVTVAKKPASLGVGMRDPARALKMADGNWYVGAGSGFGGTGPKSNSQSGLPNSGTGCLAWFKATNSTLQDFEYIGCLLQNNHTTGFIDPRTVAWNQTDRVAAFFECPDIYPLGSTGKYVAMASLYNWAAGGYYTNEWFLGTIENSKTFKVEDRGLLDYGQYYAARTGSENQSATGRRVLFSATGWHNPPGMASCHTQLHLIPRDVRLDAKGRITFSPIPEIASTLRTRRSDHAARLRHPILNPYSTAMPLLRLTVAVLSGWRVAGVPGSRVSLSANSQPGQAGTSATLTSAKGSSLELHLNCTGSATSGRAGLRILGTPDGKKYTEVAYDYASKRLVIDHSMSAGVPPPPSPPPVPPKCTGAKQPCPSAP
eukprot:COSAG02_NODE_97_length_37159_cov_37.660335_16_plen_502_part_00